MQNGPYAEYVGISQRVSALIEARRKSPLETKDEILLRELGGEPTEPSAPNKPNLLDLGQGARLVIGEKIHLYLNKAAKSKGKPDAIGIVGDTGIVVDGVAYARARGFLDQAMKAVQHRNRHVDSAGVPISLSAWRCWHALRGGKLVRLLELKDPALAHTRSRDIQSSLTAEDMGLY